MNKTLNPICHFVKSGNIHPTKNETVRAYILRTPSSHKYKLSKRPNLQNLTGNSLIVSKHPKVLQLPSKSGMFYFLIINILTMLV